MRIRIVQGEMHTLLYLHDNSREILSDRESVWEIISDESYQKNR